MQLNSKEAIEAWEDYRAFITGLGIQLEHEGQRKALTRQIEQAFKFGYAQAAAENKTAYIPPNMPPMDSTPANTVLETKETVNRGKGRRRTEQEVINDTEVVKAVLRRNGQPMQLQDITEAVNNAGCDWYPKSASGHMVKVMEMDPIIKKVGYGVYEYQRQDLFKNDIGGVKND